MITSLYIRNYALIEEIEVEFSGGLNVLTGETGAGKSILVGALAVLLGERASVEMIRKGADKGIVEGHFTVGGNEPARQFLGLHEYGTDDRVVVRREITSRGTSRGFINDSPAPISLIRDLGDLLVDLHGQHDHQLLLRPSTHLHLLDDAGGLSKIVSSYQAEFSRVAELERRLEELQQREHQLREKSEFYQFQLREFDTVRPDADEESRLEQELRLLENSEQLVDLTTSIHSLLYANDNSVRDQLVRVRNLLDRLSSIEPQFLEQHSELAAAILAVEEIARSVQSYAAGMDVSFDRLGEIRERLVTLGGLRKKFGGTMEAALGYRDRIRREVDLARNFDAEIMSLVNELSMSRIRAGDVAMRLSRKRHEVSKRISRSVEHVLRTLGIEHATFTVELEMTAVEEGVHSSVTSRGDHYAATNDGCDVCEFFISTNMGEEPKPLAKVASGGEISRVMLALKTILAKNDRLPLLVFDEIDAGISGRIAARVGSTMRELANYHQIIAITHLPQIAAMSLDHFVVSKSEVSGRTITSVRRLSSDEHMHEVARLVSGEDVTDASIRMAKELINS